MARQNNFWKRSKFGAIIQKIDQLFWLIYASPKNKDHKILKFTTEGKEEITIDAYIADVKNVLSTDKKAGKDIATKMIVEPAQKSQFTNAQAKQIAEWYKGNIEKFAKGAEESKQR